MTDPEHSSISSGMTVPNWMRSKTERNEIDGISFSPPPHDDSFFYIRYPVDNNKKFGKNTLASKLYAEPHQINDVSHALTAVSQHHNNQSSSAQQTSNQTMNFSKHTQQCRRFLNESSVDGVKNPPKSFGTDDGFKGPNATCGSSIIKVAQQMVSAGGRSLTGRGFKVANLENEDIEPSSCQLKTVEDQQLQSRSLIQPEPYELEAQAQKYNRLVRRGSKSLPASPIGSPKSMRKYQPNPYFTGTFTVANTGNPEGRGWFLSSLLGIQREATPTSSVHQIDEEPENAYNKNLSLNGKTNINNNGANNINNSTKDLHQKVLKAKPSELREMNFWSPTSM